MTSAGTGQVAGVLTVPTDKVWKITSASAAELPGGSEGGRTLRVNNHVLYERRANGNISMNTPYWLSAGSHTVTMTGGSTKVASLSVVEFNVIP